MGYKYRKGPHGSRSTKVRIRMQPFPPMKSFSPVLSQACVLNLHIKTVAENLRIPCDQFFGLFVATTQQQL